MSTEYERARSPLTERQRQKAGRVISPSVMVTKDRDGPVGVRGTPKEVRKAIKLNRKDR